ncbi:hypothetical protein FE633_07350 [Streptomyces montanus]|uniref:Uncharacterized protein n=1 Tax=Streptomyces montanus TaxID=2580423 RepID=A0A5R9FSA3_9ACTN|nr:hypothetical protein [Streptomyces montanus]TLS46897.1 hypothetical protein FE633_07350 [Streptomyces montanus]
MDAALHALDARTRDADLLAWHVDYRKLPAEAYPNLAATVDHIPPLDSPDSFALPRAPVAAPGRGDLAARRRQRTQTHLRGEPGHVLPPVEAVAEVLRRPVWCDMSHSILSID